MQEHRFEFSVEDKPVGRFLGGDYPSRPGRYRYDPCRGEGHVLLVSQLEKGELVACSFVCSDAVFRIVIEQEVFVPATPESYWFVGVSKIEQTSGLPNPTVQRTEASRSALLPIRTLPAAGSRR